MSRTPCLLSVNSHKLEYNSRKSTENFNEFPFHSIEMNWISTRTKLFTQHSLISLSFRCWKYNEFVEAMPTTTEFDCITIDNCIALIQNFQLQKRGKWGIFFIPPLNFTIESGAFIFGHLIKLWCYIIRW